MFRPLLLITATAIVFTGFGRGQQFSTSHDAPNDLAASILDARTDELKKEDFGSNSEEVERRLAVLYNNSSKNADEAVVLLMSFYLGEDNGEELYDNLLSRGIRMIPLIEKYLPEEPALINRYPKGLHLRRSTTVMFLKEALEILRVQAGARHIASTAVETAPLRKQSGECELKLVSRPHLKFPDNLIQPGESYRATPVLRADIQESGNLTNAQILTGSGIKKLDVVLLNNVREWKYTPRPGCGLVQSNIAVTVDWTAN